MSDDRKAQFHLERDLHQSAAFGNHPFIAKLTLVLESAGYDVSYKEHGEADHAQDAFVLSHMRAPPARRGLVFRRAYEYPFWQIEKSAQRWDWDVANARFDPAAVPGPDAARFYRFWQKRLYGAAPQTTTRAGYIYVPLQGRLLEKRSFQTCSPIQMIAHCLRHDPARKVIATIHPNQSYSAQEIATLDALEQENPRLRVETGGMVPLLQGCDYVVTQNSSVAFAGYFFGKPALLFGKVDFHHIAVSADMADLPACFAAVVDASPDYARYLWWFWQDQSINAGRDDVFDKIAVRLRRFGWPMD